MKTDFIFLHGGGRGGWCWTPTIEEMGSSGSLNIGKLTALDFPGCGAKKQISASDCTISGFVNSIVRDIESLDLKNAIIVGHSFAGLIIPYVVTQMPDRFKRAVFMACAIPPEGHSLRDLLIMMGKVRPNAKPDNRPPKDRFPGEWNLQRSAKRLGKTRAQWLINRLTEEFKVTFPLPSTEPITRKGFKGLVPITWLLLTRDRSMPPKWQQEFAHWVAGVDADIVHIQAEHDAMISQPEDVAKALISYL